MKKNMKKEGAGGRTKLRRGWRGRGRGADDGEGGPGRRRRGRGAGDSDDGHGRGDGEAGATGGVRAAWRRRCARRRRGETGEGNLKFPKCFLI